MDNTKRNRNIVTILSLLMLAFMISHTALTGRLFLWNFPASTPTVFFVMIPILFMIYEASKKQKRLIGILAALLSLILGMMQIDLNFPRLKRCDSQSEEYRQVKVLNWNTFYWDQNKDKDQFYAFLKKQDADIYVLQEYLHNSLNLKEAQIDEERLFSLCPALPGFPPHYLSIDDSERVLEEFPGYYFIADKQFAIISRFPIESYHTDYSEQYLVCDINIYGRTVRFFNVHMILHILPQNPFSPKFYQSLKNRFAARELGFKRLKEDIENSGDDYFISGDFNSTKAMGVMRDIMKGHTDGVSYSRELFPMTFEFWGLRLWRFDYTLLPKDNINIKFKSYKNIDHMGLSDHTPQLLVLNIKDNVISEESDY